ncbi:protein DJ-1 homolog A-like isoform X1 [Oryza brachyantha]|uniref:protein DJ-1 homolog A-like isoform X1 n=1 Tax=Oryza brachyantha TaxID=4533 RepID=UPI001AD97E07|nr:protein DJ-1 homolog A-like isoform X1 [Oryza brachyantha]
MASRPAKKVLVPIVAGTEPVEATVPIDVLRRAGAHVTVASADGFGGLVVEAMYGVRIVADALVAPAAADDVDDSAAARFDLIVLPLILPSAPPIMATPTSIDMYMQGGVPGAANLGGCAALEAVVRRHAATGGLYSAICAAPPLALASWGLLDGRKATAHPLFVDKFPPEVAAVDASVVVDGSAVTSRGPATSSEFALALVEQLYGKGKAEQIAEEMLVKYEAGYTIDEVNSVQWKCNGTPKVLVPVANGTEEMELITIVDVLRRAEAADVVVASAEDAAEVVARHGMRIVADTTLDEAAAAAGQTSFDLIILPGGTPGAKTMSSNEKLVALLKKQAAASKPYGAIGAATAHVLEPHGLLEGKKAAVHPSMAAAGLPKDGAGEGEGEGSRVVVDGNVITGSSAGTAMEFAVAAVEKLLGRDVAQRVAEGLLF